MVRPGSVTYEAVEQACFTLLAKGESPSFNTVYAELGNRGSSEIVQRFIDQWRRATGENFLRKRTVPGLPDDFVSIGDQFLGEVWRICLGHAELKLQGQRDALEEQREEVTRRLGEAQHETDVVRTELAGAEGRIAVLTAELEGRDTTILELRTQLADITRLREQQDSRIRALDETAETRESRHATEIERLNKQLAEERERGNQLLREEAQRGQMERDLLMKQIENARQEKVAELAAARQQTATVEDRESRQRARADEAEAALREALTRQRQHETSIAAAQDRIERLQKALDTATQAASKKESAIAAAEARAKAVEDYRLAETARADHLQQELADAREKLASITRSR